MTSRTTTVSTIAKGLFALALGAAVPGAARAMPAASMPSPGTPGVQTIALGCGIGQTRDAMGHCRRRFNLFDHHDRRRFDHYRSNHCTKMRTPNGMVRRCRI